MYVVYSRVSVCFCAGVCTYYFLPSVSDGRRKNQYDNLIRVVINMLRLWRWCLKKYSNCHFQGLHQRVVNVLLLNGRNINITCNSISTTAKQILDTVIKAENLYENFFLGLCALIGGDFVFLPTELKVSKVFVIRDEKSFVSHVYKNERAKRKSYSKWCLVLWVKSELFHEMTLVNVLKCVPTHRADYKIIVYVRKSVLGVVWRRGFIGISIKTNPVIWNFVEYQNLQTIWTKIWIVISQVVGKTISRRFPFKSFSELCYPNYWDSLKMKNHTRSHNRIIVSSI